MLLASSMRSVTCTCECCSFGGGSSFCVGHDCSRSHLISQYGFHAFPELVSTVARSSHYRKTCADASFPRLTGSSRAHTRLFWISSTRKRSLSRSRRADRTARHSLQTPRPSTSRKLVRSLRLLSSWTQLKHTSFDAPCRDSQEADWSAAKGVQQAL